MAWVSGKQTISGLIVLGNRDVAIAEVLRFVDNE